MPITDLLIQAQKSRHEELLKPILDWHALEPHKILQFKTEMRWADSADIDIFSVVGTQHPDYAGLPRWSELLDVGKRMKNNLGLFKENPGYYYETSRKIPTMYYQGLANGKYYVGADGNHRTAIFKAASALSEGDGVLHGVSITNYVVDLELIREYDALADLSKAGGFNVDVITAAVSRDDGEGWMTERYNPKIKVFEYRTQRQYIFDAEGARSFAYYISCQKSFLGRIKNLLLGGLARA